MSQGSFTTSLILREQVSTVGGETSQSRTGPRHWKERAVLLTAGASLGIKREQHWVRRARFTQPIKRVSCWRATSSCPIHPISLIVENWNFTRDGLFSQFSSVWSHLTNTWCVKWKMKYLLISLFYFSRQQSSFFKPVFPFYFMLQSLWKQSQVLSVTTPPRGGKSASLRPHHS